MASITLNSMLSSTICFTSASVMYPLFAVSYSRRFGYFLMMRGESLIKGSTVVHAGIITA